MHQQSRHPPRAASPAASLQTNPTRTNNSREPSGTPTRPVQDSAPMAESGDGAMIGPSKESIKKLDQIIQNFYNKAAVLILQSRMNVTSAGSRRLEGRKTNKWFQIETDDIDDFREELRVWKTCGGFDNQPPPMVIETYLDASRLSPSQSLVIVDENGKRWDVLEMLNASDSSSDGGSSRARKRNTEVILERWRVELKSLQSDTQDDFGPTLPTIYKRSIVFFRSLFVTTRILPAWKFSQQAMMNSIHPSLSVKCRVVIGDPEMSGFDPLRQPLYDSQDVASDYLFGDLEVPVGRFYASVAYRMDCNFRVDDAESLLSSRFMGVDENFFKPSVPQSRDIGRRESHADVGSLPSNRHRRHMSEQQQTYGSLSTFHGGAPLGTSPISALKAIKTIGSDTSSPPESAPNSIGPDPPHSLPIAATASRPFLRQADGLSRRPSVSFQPFKAGSLSSSPRIHDAETPGSPQSLTRPSGLSGITQSRNRSSLTAGMAASLRAAPSPIDAGVSGSPKPNPSRYSSSFTHRRGRSSFGGASKAGDDDQGSSGKQSLSSSVAQPGSGLLAEAGGASSGSFQTDDDNISDFLKALDSSKMLSSFDPSKKNDAAAKRTAAQLSRFQLMRDSNNALTESITSSIHLQKSSISSSRQIANVPAMVNPASVSASSSPNKPHSPHTPHTPAIPSRLSENSIIDYPAQAQVAHRQRTSAESRVTEQQSTAAPVSQEGTIAIDIPLSPRLLQINNNRRSSSVAQQRRTTIDDDDVDLPFGGNRSISLGADEREPPTLSTLLGMEHEPADTAGSSSPSLQPAADIRPSSVARSSVSSADREKNPPSDLMSPGSGSGSPLRLRYVGSTAVHRGRPTPPQSSRGSFVGSSSGRYGSIIRGDNEPEDEPLVFAISDLQRDLSRRSLEENQGAGGAADGSGPGSGERGGYTSRGSKKSW